MRDPIVRYEVTKLNDRRYRNPDRMYLRGLTEYGDWKLLAVFDDAEDIDRWCSRLGVNEAPFRKWFAEWFAWTDSLEVAS